MASLYFRNGRAEIQFVDGARKRRTLRLGKMTRRTAERILDHVKAINAANIHGQAIDEDNARWLARIDSAVAERLAAAELIPPRSRPSATTLGAFIDRYIETRTDVKPGTVVTWKRARTHLVRVFGEDRDLRDITAGDAKDWRVKLLESLSDTTTRRTCGIAKQFFDDAIDRKLIDENPFRHRDIPTNTNEGNEDRQFFVSRQMIGRVLDECPDDEWRLIVALSRYGGLRCPSEHVRLTWDDIDWEAGRMTVRSPKTEHHKGKAKRTVPIFPELRPYLEAVYADTPRRLRIDADTPQYVIATYRSSAKNFRTRLTKIIKRSGQEPWPKLFHNMRSSRQTELQEYFKPKTVCAWMGNSITVAFHHYDQVTDDEFDRAANPPPAEARRNARQQRRVARGQAR